MADIIINEISQNYSYVIGNDSFATVALPITSSWGPGYFDPATLGLSDDVDEAKQIELEDVVWQRFPANQTGIEAFVSMYRGPANNYRLAKDYSYQMAMTLMSAGYDVLVCRLNPGTKAQAIQLRDHSQDKHFEKESFSSRLKHTPVSPNSVSILIETSDNKTILYADDGLGKFICDKSIVPNVSIDYDTGEIRGITANAKVTYDQRSEECGKLILEAKYPGSFGNRLLCTLKKMRNRPYWNLITYMIDTTGVKFSVENKTFTFEIKNSDDSVPHLDEIESDYISIQVDGVIKDNAKFGSEATNIVFSGGADRPADPVKRDNNRNVVRDADGSPVVDVDQLMDDAINFAKRRYDRVMHISNPNYDSLPRNDRYTLLDSVQYIEALYKMKENNPDAATASVRKYAEWLYTEVLDVYDLLLDRLSYGPNRIISPGWDDQDILELTPDADIEYFTEMSPLHHKLMYVAYYSRCGTSYIDVPKSLKRKYVYNDSTDVSTQGYAQLLSRYEPTSEILDIDGTLYPTHSAMFGPWGTYKYVGVGKYCPASPSFLALLIQRSMIKNQPLQYEWIQPSTRKCDIKIGKMSYSVPQKILDLWQPEPDQEGGVGVNAVGVIPSLGLSVWGDSTLYENPPAVYQALRNLSTRLLVNALKDQAYRAGLSITWNYNNETAYSKFYVSLTPLCETMRNAGAIEDYYIRMSADLDKLGMIKANSVLGKVFIIPTGTVQRITIDLICLPPGSSINDFTAV